MLFESGELCELPKSSNLDEQYRLSVSHNTRIQLNDHDIKQRVEYEENIDTYSVNDDTNSNSTDSLYEVIDNKVFNILSYVITRSGNKEPVDFHKVNNRIINLTTTPYMLQINPACITQKVINEIRDEITTTELDDYAAKVAYQLSTLHPDYGVLAVRIAVDNYHKNTKDCFSDCMQACYYNYDESGLQYSKISTLLYQFVSHNKIAINKMIDYDRDFNFTYFGFITLVDKYLLKVLDIDTNKDKPYERPQDLFMRVSCAIHMNRNDIYDISVLRNVKITYDALSMQMFTFATPTLYNAGTNYEQYISCFLIQSDDSLNGIMHMLSNAAQISKASGGVGFTWDLRSKGIKIKTINGRTISEDSRINSISC